MSWFPIAVIIGLVLGFSMLGMANLIDVTIRATYPMVQGTVRSPAKAAYVPRTGRGWLAVWVSVDFEWQGTMRTCNGFSLRPLESRYGQSLSAAEAFATSLNVGQSIPLYVSRRDPRNVEIFPPRTASLLPACMFLPAAYFFGRMWWYAVFRPKRSPSIVVAAMLVIPATLGFIDLALGSVLPPWLGLSVLIALAGVLLIRACIFRYSAASPVKTPGR